MTSYAVILDFHPCDLTLDNGCYLPSLCPSKVNKERSVRLTSSMVLSLVFGCFCKSRKHRVTSALIPKIVTDQGEEHEKLTRERRRLSILAISSGNTNTKNVLDMERVCGLQFVSGKAAPVLDLTGGCSSLGSPQQSVTRWQEVMFTPALQLYSSTSCCFLPAVNLWSYTLI